jgi:hypothetical protein
MPVTILNSPSVSNPNNVIIPFGTSRDIVGTIMWGIGFLIEVVGKHCETERQSSREVDRPLYDGQPINRNIITRVIDRREVVFST